MPRPSISTSVPTVLILCSACYFLGRSGRDPKATGIPQSPAPPPVTSVQGSGSPASTLPAFEPSHLPIQASNPAPPTSNPAPTAPPATPATIADLNALADGPRPLRDKMAVLTTMMRTPSPLVAAAATRSVFIVKDQDYEAMLTPIVSDRSVPREALDVLMLNVHDRDPAIRLRTLAAVARCAGHPFAAEARDSLAFHLGGSLPEPPAAVDRAIDAWLSGSTKGTQNSR